MVPTGEQGQGNGNGKDDGIQAVKLRRLKRNASQEILREPNKFTSPLYHLVPTDEELEKVRNGCKKRKMNDSEINDFIQQYEKNRGLAFQKEFEEFNLGAVIYKPNDREDEMLITEWILIRSRRGWHC